MIESNPLNILVEQELTYHQLIEKIKSQKSNLKLKDVTQEFINSDTNEQSTEDNKVSFKLEFIETENPQTLDEYFNNFYVKKQEDIYKLINGDIKKIKIFDFFKTELNKQRIKIEPKLSFKIMPNLLYGEQGEEKTELTCIKIEIPFEGDLLNWQYFNLLEIIPKSENINIMTQFHSVSQFLFEAEVVIESKHLEYAIRKLKERIFSEEKRILAEYNKFLNIAFSRIEKQFNKSELIHATLFSDIND